MDSHLNFEIGLSEDNLKIDKNISGHDIMRRFEIPKSCMGLDGMKMA